MLIENELSSNDGYCGFEQTTCWTVLWLAGWTRLPTVICLVWWLRSVFWIVLLSMMASRFDASVGPSRLSMYMLVWISFVSSWSLKKLFTPQHITAIAYPPQQTSERTKTTISAMAQPASPPPSSDCVRAGAGAGLGTSVITSSIEHRSYSPSKIVQKFSSRSLFPLKYLVSVNDLHGTHSEQSINISLSRNFTYTTHWICVSTSSYESRISLMIYGPKCLPSSRMTYTWKYCVTSSTRARSCRSCRCRCHKLSDNSTASTLVTFNPSIFPARRSMMRFNTISISLFIKFIAMLSGTPETVNWIETIS